MCLAVGYQMDLPLLQNNNIFMSWNFQNLQPSFKMNKQWRLIAKSKLKRYVHANNHRIKGFRCEQTLMGRKDRHNLIW